LRFTSVIEIFHSQKVVISNLWNTFCYSYSMRCELKIRVDDVPDIEERIMRAGGRKGKKATYEYIYFNQPEGDVLKITKKPEGNFKTIIKARNGKFDIISSDLINNENELVAELTTKFGVKKKIINHRSFFTLGMDKLSLNAIEGVGKVLIIEGTDPSIEVTVRLGIVNPEVVTKSFDNL
jgi:adenylate cyclase class IV